MIRQLLAWLAHRDEIAELRDRAATDAATIDRLKAENARVVARLDQVHAVSRDVADLLHRTGHTGTRPGCVSCVIVAALDQTRQATQ